LARNGASLECASPAEVSLVRCAGFPNEKILYNTPLPEGVVALDVIKTGGGIVIDSKEFLEELDGLL
jgi:diaminopimelate decarboxylase